jgi:hypothetical protein
VREQSLLWGSAMNRAGRSPGERSALVLRADGNANYFAPDSNMVSESPAVCEQVPAVLVDPNPAIRAAGLTEAFAIENGLKRLSDPSGFLARDVESTAGDEAMRSLSVSGTVSWWGTCDDRKLRKEFRALGVYPETIKVRGTDHDPAALFKRYRQCGDRPVTLWIGRYKKRVFAALTD